MNKLSIGLFLIFTFCLSFAFSNPFNILKLNQTPIECPVCIVAIDIVNGILKQNKTDQAIIKDLQNVCNLLHGDQTIQNV